MQNSSSQYEKIFKAALTLSAVFFLYWFFKDSYEEVFFNPVHYFDDAYMFIRYARIWHLGYGEAWNIGEAPVYGNTSQLHFLFVLLLTSFTSLSDDMVVKLASYIPAFILMAWLPWFCLRHSSLFARQNTWQKYVLWVGLICPLVYWNTPYNYHFLTGMDTCLSALLQLLLIDAVLSFKNSPRLLPFIAALIYLAYATRPENIVACSLFVIGYLYLVEKNARDVLVIMASTAVLVVLDGLFKYWYFGDIVPLAFYTKSTGFFDGFAGHYLNHPFFPIFSCLLWLWPFLAVLVFSATKKNSLRMAVFIVPVLLTVAYFFTMLNIMNIKARYEYPFLFYFIALAVIQLDTIAFTRRNRNRVLLSAVIAIGLLVGFRIGDNNTGNIVRYLVEKQGDPGLCPSPVLDDPADIPSPVRYTWQDKIFQITDVFTHAPAGVKVVTTEHGYFGVKNLQINIIDVAGLHNSYIAHHGFSVEWLYAQKPDVIWLPHWHYTCLNHRLIYNDEFIQHYRLFPGLFNLGIALRTDSPNYDVLYNLVNQKVMEKFPGYTLVDFERKVQQ